MDRPVIFGRSILARLLQIEWHEKALIAVLSRFIYDPLVITVELTAPVRCVSKTYRVNPIVPRRHWQKLNPVRLTNSPYLMGLAFVISAFACQCAQVHPVYAQGETNTGQA